jgi:SAM-dependent methyltransferase
MPDWGQIFAAPEMQELQPNPELLALLPEIRADGCRRVLDAGCGVGRQLMPLSQAGLKVWGVDREARVLQILRRRLQEAGVQAPLAQADLRCLPFPPGVFDLVVSINVINHGKARIFREFCRELDRVLQPRGRLFIYVSPREFGELVRLPQTRELEPGTLVDIATPDGSQIHHFPTPQELLDRFPGYQVLRAETLQAPIPFMAGVVRPQFLFWGQKPR